MSGFCSLLCTVSIKLGVMTEGTWRWTRTCPLLNPRLSRNVALFSVIFSIYVAAIVSLWEWAQGWNSWMKKKNPSWWAYWWNYNPNSLQGQAPTDKYGTSMVSWCIPADRDEVFSLHADAPSRRLFRCQTHSHCCLNTARLHPAAAPGPLRDSCPGQDLSLRGPWVLQTPAVLCGSHGCCYSRCWKRRRTGSKRLEPSYTYLSVHIPVKTFKIKPSSRFHHRFMNYTGISSLLSGKKDDCWCFYVCYILPYIGR